MILRILIILSVALIFINKRNFQFQSHTVITNKHTHTHTHTHTYIYIYIYIYFYQGRSVAEICARRYISYTIRIYFKQDNTKNTFINFRGGFPTPKQKSKVHIQTFTNADKSHDLHIHLTSVIYILYARPVKTIVLYYRHS